MQNLTIVSFLLFNMQQWNLNGWNNKKNIRHWPNHIFKLAFYLKDSSCGTQKHYIKKVVFANLITLYKYSAIKSSFWLFAKQERYFSKILHFRLQQVALCLRSIVISWFLLFYSSCKLTALWAAKTSWYKKKEQHLLERQQEGLIRKYHLIF